MENGIYQLVLLAIIETKYLKAVILRKVFSKIKLFKFFCLNYLISHLKMKKYYFGLVQFFSKKAKLGGAQLRARS